MERIDNIGFGELKLIQDTEQFCYGLDAVILADFAFRICGDFKNAVDLGTGTGIIPFILSHKNSGARFTGVELQEAALDMARRSAEINGLSDRIRFMRGNVAELDISVFRDQKVDMVTCNPPYFPKGGGIPSGNPSRFAARHETVASIDDFIKAAADILDGRGHFFLVNRPSRLVDIFYSCREYDLEPKHVRFVAPKADEVPNIVLVHCAAGGGKELRVMKELPVYGPDGEYSDEIMKIYERDR